MEEALLPAQAPQGCLIPSGDAASLQERIPCSRASLANTNQDSAAFRQLVLQGLSPGWEGASQHGELGASAPADPTSEAGGSVPLTADSGLIARAGASCAAFSQSDGVTAHSVTA